VRARGRHSCTVERAEPSQHGYAIWRSLSRASFLRRSTSRILRTGQLAWRHEPSPGHHPKRSRLARLSCSLYRPWLCMERGPAAVNPGPASRGILATDMLWNCMRWKKSMARRHPIKAYAPCPLNFTLDITMRTFLFSSGVIYAGRLHDIGPGILGQLTRGLRTRQRRSQIVVAGELGVQLWVGRFEVKGYTLGERYDFILTLAVPAESSDHSEYGVLDSGFHGCRIRTNRWRGRDAMGFGAADAGRDCAPGPFWSGRPPSTSPLDAANICAVVNLRRAVGPAMGSVHGGRGLLARQRKTKSSA